MVHLKYFWHTISILAFFGTITLILSRKTKLFRSLLLILIDNPFGKALRMSFSQYKISSIITIIAIILVLKINKWQTPISNLIIQMSTAYTISYVFFIGTNIHQTVKMLLPLKKNIQYILNWHKSALGYLLKANLTREELKNLDSTEILYEKIKKIGLNRPVNYFSRIKERKVNALEALQECHAVIKRDAENILQLNYNIPSKLQEILFKIMNCDGQINIIYKISAEQFDLSLHDGNPHKYICKYFVEHHQLMYSLSQFFNHYLCRDFSFIDPNYPQRKPG